MEINEVLKFTKDAIRKNLAKRAFKDEIILSKALDMIEEFEHKNECLRCPHFIQMGVDCSLPSLTPCPKLD